MFPICVNASTWDHQLEELPSKEGRPKTFGIRLGFRLVSGLSEKAVNAVVDARNKWGAWQSLDDFISKVSIYRDDYSSLAAANAFQVLGISRFDALWRAEAVPYKTLVDVEERKLQWKKRGTFQKSQLDFKSFGTSLETHPVKVLRQHHWAYDLKASLISKSIDLEKMKADAHVHCFGMILAKQAPPSAKGMVFITLEDETGFVNLALAPKTYNQFYKIVEQHGFLCISGKLQKASNYHSILVSHVHTENRSDLKSLHKDNGAAASSPNVVNLKPRNYY